MNLVMALVAVNEFLARQRQVHVIVTQRFAQTAKELMCPPISSVPSRFGA
jgi:hypothetical protein